jgi:PEP-CTERM motif-containing protein
MDQIRKLLFVGLALLFTAIGPARAIDIPLVVGMDADDVIVNFDFSSAATPPPYALDMLIGFDIRVFAAPADLVIDFYDGLDGSTLIASLPGFPLTSAVTYTVTTQCPSAMASCVGVLDGIFSMGLHLGAGAADLYQFIAPPIATGFNAPLDFAATVPGTVGTRSIPEPGTLALLAGGLVMLGGSIGRRSR